jgi:flagellar biosynthetic protein FlhB
MTFTGLYLGSLLQRIQTFVDRGIFGLVGENIFVPGFLRGFLPGSAQGDVLTWGVFFAAEDEGRTEDPTERKRQKEREKGRVPKSPEIPAALVTIGGLMVLFFLGQSMLKGLKEIMAYFLGNFAELGLRPDKESMITLLITVVTKSGMIMAPLLLIGMIMAVVGNVAQVGFMFTLKPIQPDFSRIKFSFQNMIRKVFFSRQIAVNLIKSLAKVILLAWVGYYIIYNDFLSLMKLSGMGVAQSLRELGYIAFKLLMILTVILLALAIPDYAYQRYEFTESIKMTKEEVKQETREMEGDPLTKQRRRQKSYDMYRRNMLKEVKKADVVITNPTHYAVALRYDPLFEDAPRVLAKGADHLAFMIRNLARQNEITIVENKPLARELYANVAEGELVPEQFYRVLIDIFVNIEGIRERLAQRVS